MSGGGGGKSLRRLNEMAGWTLGSNKETKMKRQRGRDLFILQSAESRGGRTLRRLLAAAFGVCGFGTASGCVTTHIVVVLRKTTKS